MDFKYCVDQSHWAAGFGCPEIAQGLCLWARGTSISRGSPYLRGSRLAEAMRVDLHKMGTSRFSSDLLGLRSQCPGSKLPEFSKVIIPSLHHKDSNKYLEDGFIEGEWQALRMAWQDILKRYKWGLNSIVALTVASVSGSSCLGHVMYNLLSPYWIPLKPHTVLKIVL